MQATEAPRQSNSQNSKISLGCVDFYAKTFLILYPSLENSTTPIAIATRIRSWLSFLPHDFCWTLGQIRQCEVALEHNKVYKAKLNSQLREVERFWQFFGNVLRLLIALNKHFWFNPFVWNNSTCSLYTSCEIY